MAADELASLEDVRAIRASDELLAAAVRQPAWRQRLRKRGHMFCRLYWEWMQEVCDSLDPATPPHFVPWHLLPGFKTMLIGLLLEMRSRSVVTYSEPLVHLACVCEGERCDVVVDREVRRGDERVEPGGTRGVRDDQPEALLRDREGEVEG